MTFPQPKAPEFSKIQKEVLRIKGDLDKLILNINKQPKFAPTRDMLESQAKRLIDLINKNPLLKATPQEKAIKSAVEKYLKAAIIDLTEVPEMSPQMQRISYLTALKDAAKNLELFLG